MEKEPAVSKHITADMSDALREKVGEWVQQNLEKPDLSKLKERLRSRGYISLAESLKPDGHCRIYNPLDGHEFELHWHVSHSVPLDDTAQTIIRDYEQSEFLAFGKSVRFEPKGLGKICRIPMTERDIVDYTYCLEEELEELHRLDIESVNARFDEARRRTITL